MDKKITVDIFGQVKKAQRPGRDDRGREERQDVEGPPPQALPKFWKNELGGICLKKPVAILAQGIKAQMPGRACISTCVFVKEKQRVLKNKNKEASAETHEQNDI